MATFTTTTHLLNHSGKAPALGNYMAEVYQYRQFITALTVRAIKARYAQTLLGSLWIVIQPLINLSVFVLVFDKLMGIYRGNIPYALFAFAGLISWNLFSFISQQGGIAVVQHRDLLKRLYFPKIILVIVQVIIGFADFAIGLVIIVLAMPVLGVGFSVKMLALPGFVLLNILTGLAIAVFMNIISVKRRDYYQALPYFINFGMWITPVFYPISIIPQQYRFLLYGNPMAGIIQGYRVCLFNEGQFDLAFLPVYILFSALAIAGIYRFKETEHTFVDSI